jgi:hypothetical protein
LAVAGKLRQTKSPAGQGGASMGGKAKPQLVPRPHAAYRDSPSTSKRGASIRPAGMIEGAASVIYLGKRSRHRETIMRGWTTPLAVLAIAGFAASASAQGKIRLAQTSVTTTCMMTCNSQYALCQSSCLASGTQTQSTAPGTIVGANVNANQSCLASCTNIQLQCQINTCARASPSR